MVVFTRAGAETHVRGRTSETNQVVSASCSPSVVLAGLSLAAALAVALACDSIGEEDPERPPNIILVLADELGYGDLSIQGHPLIHTPHIDTLAREGQRWTSFYASAPLCNPSRVALVTGRMPIRIHGDGRNAWANMPDPEVTMAEMLKELGYATAYIGKWGLSGRFDYQGSHPNDQGFDHFYGLVGSNDAPLREGFDRTYENIRNSTSADFPISLYRQREAIETPAFQPTLTRRYTEESVRWIRDQGDRPFLLFLATACPTCRSSARRSLRDTATRGCTATSSRRSTGRLASSSAP